MITTAAILLLLILGGYLFLNQPQFGKVASGERLERIKRSPHYRDGKFQNLSPTSDLTEGATFFKVLKEQLFNKSETVRPPAVLP